MGGAEGPQETRFGDQPSQSSAGPGSEPGVPAPLARGLLLGSGWGAVGGPSQGLPARRLLFLPFLAELSRVT